MPSCSDGDLTVTSWGRRDGHRVWRIQWRSGAPGRHAEHTGPDSDLDAFVRAGRVVREHPTLLAWTDDPGEPS